jgi:uncharacterized protein DUF11
MLRYLIRIKFPWLLTIFFTAVTTPGCAQQRPTQMIPGASVKELIPESSDANSDGIAEIVLGQLFTLGNTEYTRVGAQALKDAPPFPTGYLLFKDLVYKIKTEAGIAGSQITVFRITSAASETEFGKLAILHLEEDEMSPSGYSWAEVTVSPGGWDEHFHFVPKAQYQAHIPDFKSRRLAAMTHEFGTFAVAIMPPPAQQPPGSFTKFEVTVPVSNPDPVPIGEVANHKIILQNKGPNSAAEVNVKIELNPDFTDVSATSSQGNCKSSTASKGRMLCYLGAMSAGATANITVRGRVRSGLIQNEDLDETANDLEVIYKASPTDFAQTDNQILRQFNTRILKHR